MWVLRLRPCARHDGDQAVRICHLGGNSGLAGQALQGDRPPKLLLPHGALGPSQSSSPPSNSSPRLANTNT
eukprot:5036526-Pyramimonas_sp.AAC.1